MLEQLLHAHQNIGVDDLQGLIVVIRQNLFLASQNDEEVLIVRLVHVMQALGLVHLSFLLEDAVVSIFNQTEAPYALRVPVDHSAPKYQELSLGYFVQRASFQTECKLEFELLPRVGVLHVAKHRLVSLLAALHAPEHVQPGVRSERHAGNHPEGQVRHSLPADVCSLSPLQQLLQVQPLALAQNEEVALLVSRAPADGIHPVAQPDRGECITCSDHAPHSLALLGRVLVVDEHLAAHIFLRVGYAPEDEVLLGLLYIDDALQSVQAY